LRSGRHIEDRYVRLIITGEGRIMIPPIALAHLDAAPGKHVVIVGYVDRVEFWSMRYRNKNRVPPDSLVDLP
jgi:DNA-binding transcriptional regulator/RsmH inhibitor MraZ